MKMGGEAAKCLPGKCDMRNWVKVKVDRGVQSDGKQITETLKEGCLRQENLLTFCFSG